MSVKVTWEPFPLGQFTVSVPYTTQTGDTLTLAEFTVPCPVEDVEKYTPSAADYRTVELKAGVVTEDMITTCQKIEKQVGMAVQDLLEKHGL